MKHLMEKLERLLELGGIKKNIVLLAISGAAVVCSLLQFRPFSLDPAWIAILLCGIPIIRKARRPSAQSPVSACSRCC